MTRDEFIQALQSKVVQVDFTAADGTARTMQVTLHDSLIPEEHRPKAQTPLPSRRNPMVEVLMASNPTDAAADLQPKPTVRVYAIDRAGWRSVRVDRIQSISIIKEL